jgi:hypothetical protein
MAEHRSNRKLALAAAILVIGAQPLASDAFAGQTGARPRIAIVKPVPPMPNRFKNPNGGTSQVGLLLPAVQAAREAARPAPPPPSNNDDCMSCAD